jgi:hypothetical protein
MKADQLAAMKADYWDAMMFDRMEVGRAAYLADWTVQS